MSQTADLENAMVKYVKTYFQYKNQNIDIESFSDGLIFANILKSATNFKIKHGDLMENCHKWAFRLNNLKKIVNLIEDYFEQFIRKGIKTKDIDLVEISKNNNVEETLKFFQLVIAVLTQAPNKQDHINTIMSLDQKSQGSFVWIIQNILENRIFDKKQTKEDNIMETINNLQMENNLMRREVESLLQQNFQKQKQIQELKDRNYDYEEQISKLKDESTGKITVIREEPKQKQYLKNMIDNMKQKLISTVRQNEVKISSFKQEIQILQAKCEKYEEMEEQLQDYKRRYCQSIESNAKAKHWQKEKSRLMRNLQQKQDTIKKLNAKLEKASQENFAMQQREVYSKMQLAKSDVRFRELQKQVRKKYGTNNSISLQNPVSSKTLKQKSLNEQINDVHNQQVEELKNQLQIMKKRNRQTERENNRLKRNLQKASVIQNDKKKIERLILDLSNQKRDQIQLLLTTTYEFYNQNKKLKAILLKNNIPQTVS